MAFLVDRAVFADKCGYVFYFIAQGFRNDVDKKNAIAIIGTHMAGFYLPVFYVVYTTLEALSNSILF